MLLPLVPPKGKISGFGMCEGGPVLVQVSLDWVQYVAVESLVKTVTGRGVISTWPQSMDRPVVPLAGGNALRIGGTDAGTPLLAEDEVVVGGVWGASGCPAAIRASSALRRGPRWRGSPTSEDRTDGAGRSLCFTGPTVGHKSQEKNSHCNRDGGRRRHLRVFGWPSDDDFAETERGTPRGQGKTGTQSS